MLDLKKAIQGLKTGISYSARPLTELIAENRDSQFCRLAAESDAFLFDPLAALAAAGDSLLKEQQDKDLYGGFVRGLGASDTQGQLEHISLYASLLENNLAQAREAHERKSRLYISLGLFSGLTLCIVML